MADKWKDTGFCGLFGDFLGSVLGKDETVVNTETGEVKSVYVAPSQEVGDAIAEGQFTDKPTSEWKR